MYVYELTLEDGKYYVGITNNVNRRYEQHCAGEGSAWTRAFPPVKKPRILKSKADPYDEDKYLKITMAKHGIDNVRGGQYTKMQLSYSEKQVLVREINNATGRCFRCGNPGHFATDCTATTLKTLNDATSKPLTVKKCGHCRLPGHTRRTCPSLYA